MSGADYDALIVGAGPAGASLALRLARAGRSVLLADGASFPRDKVCGEGIMPAGLRELEDLGIEVSGHPFTGICYRLPDGASAAADFPSGAQALGCRRRELDAALVAAAEREPGIDVRLGNWVHVERPGSDGFTARVGDEPVRAPVLVGADGCRSNLRRDAGLDGSAARECFGVRAHFEHAPHSGPQRVEVFLGERSELYLTPVAPTTTCVALLVDRAELGQLQGRLEAGVRDVLRAASSANPRYAELAEAPVVGAVRALGPLGQGARAAHAERLLLVGDAGGALDPITGEGVAISLVTSRIAAEVLGDAYAAGDFSARRLKAWTRRRRAELRGLTALTSFVLTLARHRRQAERVIRNLARSPATFERLLGVASGLESVRSLKLRDGFALALGV